MRFQKTVLLALALAFSAAARADQLFTYSGVFNDTRFAGKSYTFQTGPMAVVTGQTTVTQGVTGSITAPFLGPVAGISVTSLTLALYGVYQTPGYNFFVTYSDGETALSKADFTLADYATPGTYTYTSLVPTDAVSYNAKLVVAAAASPAAVTPEPSSLVLLGTGLLGSVAAIRRRSLGGASAAMQR